MRCCLRAARVGISLGAAVWLLVLMVACVGPHGTAGADQFGAHAADHHAPVHDGTWNESLTSRASHSGCGDEVVFAVAGPAQLQVPGGAVALSGAIAGAPDDMTPGTPVPARPPPGPLAPDPPGLSVLRL